MQVSFEEALSCLNKWREERALVSAMLRIGDSVAVVKGFLDIESPRVQIVGILNGERCPSFVVLDFTDAVFTYEDWRAAPPDQQAYAKKVLESVISVKLANGGACIIYATED